MTQKNDFGILEITPISNSIKLLLKYFNFTYK